MRYSVLPLLLLALGARAELKTDIVFASVGGTNLTLDAFVPEGAGPFPAVACPHGHWEHVEEYFIKHYPVSMERGACPACEEMLSLMNGKNDNITDVIARKGIESRQAEPACTAKVS